MEKPGLDAVFKQIRMNIEDVKKHQPGQAHDATNNCIQCYSDLGVKIVAFKKRSRKNGGWKRNEGRSQQEDKVRPVKLNIAIQDAPVYGAMIEPNHANIKE